MDVQSVIKYIEEKGSPFSKSCPASLQKIVVMTEEVYLMQQKWAKISILIFAKKEYVRKQ